ncbi:uncharacterized protein [Diadema antillarum]|uniref:uncharacterized protein n=1 Tax=Diadema antillarum TaxID=105358 RepID=UPI003A854A10
MAGNNSNSEQVRVMTWCTPRSTSSVFCKCLSFVPGIDIFFDTFYFAYEAEVDLATIGKVVDHDADNFGEDVWRKAAEMICEEDCSGDRVRLDMLKYPYIKKMLDNPDPNKKVILYKGVSQCMDSSHFRFLPDKSSNYRYSFLLRHPAKVFLSFKKIIFKVLQEVGDGSGKKLPASTKIENFDMNTDAPPKYRLSGLLYKELHALWLHVKENLDPSPVVVESDDILADTPRMLAKYCNALGIPYSDSLLKWEPSPAVTDSWKCAFMPVKDFEFIRLFCHNAFHTSYFLPPTPPPALDLLPPDVQKNVDICMPYYEEMYETRMT